MTHESETRRHLTEKASEALSEAVEPDEVVWLRDLDGTGSMHVCTPHCPGAIPYYREI